MSTEPWVQIQLKKSPLPYTTGMACLGCGMILFLVPYHTPGFVFVGSLFSMLAVWMVRRLEIQQDELKQNMEKRSHALEVEERERRRICEESQQLTANLEKKIEDLKKAYQLLEEAQAQSMECEKMAALGTFITGVIHDLATPLTSILGYANIASGKTENQDLKNMMSVIERETERAHEIVNDLLLFSRKAKPFLMPMDLRAPIQEALDSLEFLLKEHQIHVIQCMPKEAAMIEGNAPLFRRVIINILTNAIHALQEKESPREIRIELFRKNEDSFNLVLWNNGPSIPDAFLKKIFDPFFTTKHMGRGTGLGLSLSSGIVRDHGGNLTAVQKEDMPGVFFIITLPFLSENGPFSEGAEERKDAKTILAVDDEPEVLADIKECLESQGYVVETASNGKIAMEKIGTRNYDVIIADYLMPQMNGKLFYEAVRSARPALAKHFMFVTGSSAGNELKDFFIMNRIPFLIKPFTPEKLLDGIQSHFN